MGARRPKYCGFCGKAEHEVFMLIPGPCIYICDECVASATEVIAREKLKAGVLAVIGRFPTHDAI